MFIQDETDDYHRAKFSRRAVLMGLGQILGLGAVTSRVYQLQILEQSRYGRLADQNRINVQLLASVRGRILDRYGVVLASNKDDFQAVLVRSLTDDMHEVLHEFSTIVPLSHAARARIIARAKRQSPNLPVIIKSDLSWEQFAKLNLNAPRLAGIESGVMGHRQYFHGAAVGHIVGYTGAVQRLALDDDRVLALPGARVGKSGIERGMEQRLRGEGGRVKREVDAHGRIKRDLDRLQPKTGRDVVLTIDTQLQQRLMTRLTQERRAAAVVLDVTNGEIVAMGSAPSFDPQQIAQGISKRQWRKMATAADDPQMNRAIQGQYPPGSTFKLVTALAALQGGLVGLDEHVQCSGRYKVANHTFRCWRRSGHGAVNLHRALRESCDVFFYEMANRLGIRAIADMARRLGFGQIHDIGIAAQKPGLVPEPDWKFGRFGKSWYRGETILAGIGQGYVLATPLQLAVMSARVASGRLVKPTLLRADRGADGRADRSADRGAAAAPNFAPLDIDEKWLRAVRSGLFGVVNEPGGTGHRARLPDGEPLVAGKTGTSQVSRRSARRDGRKLAWKFRDHALFVSYFPADQPRYAISTVIEHGGGGGKVAAPLVRDILGLLLEADPAGRPAIFGPAAGTASATQILKRS